MPLHTQREEDIKEFDEKCNLRVEKGGFLYLYENNDATDTEQIKHFISNIYIKIAEENIKRLESSKKEMLPQDQEDLLTRHEREEYGQDILGCNVAISDEITYWQEELNKLKQ